MSSSARILNFHNGYVKKGTQSFFPSQSRWVIGPEHSNSCHETHKRPRVHVHSVPLPSCDSRGSFLLPSSATALLVPWISASPAFSVTSIWSICSFLWYLNILQITHIYKTPPTWPNPLPCTTGSILSPDLELYFIKCTSSPTFRFVPTVVQLPPPPSSRDWRNELTYDLPVLHAPRTLLCLSAGQRCHHRLFPPFLFEFYFLVFF